MLTRKNKKKKTWDSLCLQFNLGMLGEYNLGMTPADGGFRSGSLCGTIVMIQNKNQHIFLREIKRW